MRRTSPYTTQLSAEPLDRVRTLFIGVSTFAKLASAGVLPGSGGYELEEATPSSIKKQNQQPYMVFDSNIVAVDSFFKRPVKQTVSEPRGGLTVEEERFLVKKALEAGINLAEQQKPEEYA